MLNKFLFSLHPRIRCGNGRVGLTIRP